MATRKEYLYFILDQLSGLTEITYRSAFGEYMISYRGKAAAYLCDDRLLVKPVPSAVRMMPEAHYEPPYEGGKGHAACGQRGRPGVFGGTVYGDISGAAGT